RQSRRGEGAAGGRSGPERGDRTGGVTGRRPRGPRPPAHTDRRPTTEPGTSQPSSSAASPPGEVGTGVLDLQENGNGFLRVRPDLDRSAQDPYVASSQIRRFGLRVGQEVTGMVRPARGSERSPALERVEAVEGMTPDE